MADVRVYIQLFDDYQARLEATPPAIAKTFTFVMDQTEAETYRLLAYDEYHALFVTQYAIRWLDFTSGIVSNAVPISPLYTDEAGYVEAGYPLSVFVDSSGYLIAHWQLTAPVNSEAWVRINPKSGKLEAKMLEDVSGSPTYAPPVPFDGYFLLFDTGANKIYKVSNSLTSKTSLGSFTLKVFDTVEDREPMCACWPTPAEGPNSELEDGYEQYADHVIAWNNVSGKLECLLVGEASVTKLSALSVMHEGAYVVPSAGTKPTLCYCPPDYVYLAGYADVDAVPTKYVWRAVITAPPDADGELTDSETLMTAVDPGTQADALPAARDAFQAKMRLVNGSVI